MRLTKPLPKVMQQTVLTGASRGLFDDLQKAFRLASANLSQVEDTDTRARIQIIDEATTRRVLSINRSGKAASYVVYYTVRFEVKDQQGQVLLPLQRIQLSREYRFGASDVYGASRQEQLLRKTMRQDMAYHIVQRIQHQLI